jgi:pyruvate dehydrogenase E2 component (dihydrolipoamide acetyltransferase)
MSHEVVMPQLGLTMTAGTVTAWLRKVGDRVERGDVLFVVQTDKVEMEVESMAAGYLSSILVGLGHEVPVGTVIAILSDDPPGAG